MLTKRNSTLPKTQLFPVMERFYTIQGEGTYSGYASWFIRLAGCDVGCVWCDVKESWNAEGFPRLSAKELADDAAQSGTKIVVITGGEPCLYDLTELCKELHNKGLRVHLETSASSEIKGDFDWICISPKKFKKPLDTQIHKANELKIIVFNLSDFKWAVEYKNKVNNQCRLLLQPEWSKSNEMLPKVIDYIKKNPEWQISLQTHKYMQIP
ncbi:MAG: 7-carboxy-7-deazaguanine synthase QueE [Bacteroidia bacterium]|nr:7-carboxy-7-deazaguanine synthase QueE [Bacteroidia bacterium]